MKRVSAMVEDERHLADGLRFNLEQEGYEVEVVETGEAALDILTPGENRREFLSSSFSMSPLPGQG